MRRTTRFAQLAIAAAREAVADARLEIGDGSRIDAGDFCVLVNAAVAGFDTIEAAARQLVSGVSAARAASSLSQTRYR